MDQQVGTGFGGRIGAAGMHGSVFVGKRAGRHIAVDFISGDVDELGERQFLGGLQQNEGAGDVGLDSGGGLVDAAIDVGFGSEMDDGIAAGHGGFDAVRVANVALNEGIAGVLGDGHEIGQVASVGELVVVDDSVGLPRRQDQANEVGADKTSATSDE